MDSKRRRSVSSESVSTISTNNSPTSPQHGLRRSISPQRRRPSLSPSPKIQRERSRSLSSSRSRGHARRDRRDDSDPDVQPQRPRHRSWSRDSRSPPRHHQREYRDRDRQFVTRDFSPSPERRRGASSDARPALRERSASRSPPNRRTHIDVVGDRPGDRHPGPSIGGGGQFGGFERPGREQGRPWGGHSRQERSLSPFSKRRALTQTPGRGGR